MLRNYFKTAWRNLWRHKTFSAINIFGLSLGIASALLIIFHVKEELSYDRGFVKSDRIFRVTQEGLGDDTRHWAATSPPLAFSLQQQFPEIKTTARFYRPYPNQVLSYTPLKGEVKRFEETGGFFADSGAAGMFDIPFTRGNPENALSGTDAIVISEEMAKKYFADEDPIGKTIVDDQGKVSLRVTGVFKSYSFNTHLRFDYLLSMPTILHYQDRASLENRTWNAFYTYVLINKNSSKQQLEARLPDFTAKYFAKPGEADRTSDADTRLNLQPISSIHLHSKLEKEMYANSDIAYVYIFSIAALFILLIAAVNFINISTAQAFNRMKEIGLRKVIGGTRWQLIKQFLGESLLITLLATVLAVILFRWSLPFYNNLTSQHLRFGQLFTLTNIGFLLLLVLVIGLLSGFYPAWFVANFNPISSLKGKKVTGSSVNTVRKSLIVFQFVVSVFMIFSTLIIYRQMRYFHEKDLGFDKEQLIAVTMYENMWQHYPALLNDIRKNKSIADYAVASTLPGQRFSMQHFAPLSADPDADLGSRAMWGDERLLPTLGVPLVAGRNFFPQFPEIKKPEFIVNEAAVKALQLKDPIGKRFVLDRDTGEVVGIMKDFNFASLHSAIEPMVIQYNPYRANYLLLKVRPDQFRQTLQFLESDIKLLSPASVFSYTFIDEKLNRLYESENRMSTVFKVFAGFALFISCLGLLGLSAYSARIRIKEVGIRKLLGASISNVTLLLSRDFLKLVLLATLIAWPLGWWAMSYWLNGFAYHISIGAGVFVISGMLAFLVGLLTVSSQAVKAAVGNPVDSLRSE